LSPIAGTFVDRWDHKETLVVSDILRAALVLLVPVAAVVDILLVYPLIFAITSISVFFRPARVAILPQIVPEEDLLSANSALWVGETIADVLGYPLAAMFVTTLGAAVPLAFWVDSATYLASGGAAVDDRHPRAPRRPRSGRTREDPASSPRCRRAGASCGARRCSSRTRSRARPASSALASPSR
jgi:MFS family permease